MIGLITNYLFGAIMLDSVFMFAAPYFWFLDPFVHFVPQFAAIALLSFTLLIVQKRFAEAVVVLSIGLYFIFPLLKLYFPRDTLFVATSESARQPVTVLHANVNKRNKETDKFIQRVQAVQPTIIALNEVTEEWLSAVKKELAGEYPYSVESLSTDYRGMAVLSKLPIESHEVLVYTEETPPVLRLEFSEPRMTLYAVHALSPISREWTHQRDDLIRFLSADIQTVPGTVLVVGDFNTTVHSLTFGSFLKSTGLHDGRDGFGWNPSWLRGTIFTAAIDQILYKGHAELFNFKILPDINSDHRPVEAQFMISS